MTQQNFDSLEQSTKNLMNGMRDLASLMADEDHGAGYVQRLAAEMQDFYVQFLIALNPE
ncbi:MAG TPA: hypothetical protein PLF22_03820 [Pseudomonadales bacterium]|nr:hypothetical protein [Pseudomonadales bacterium]